MRDPCRDAGLHEANSMILEECGCDHAMDCIGVGAGG